MKLSNLTLLLFVIALFAACKSSEQAADKKVTGRTPDGRYVVVTKNRPNEKKVVDNSPVTFRKMRVDPERGYESKLRKYSVVIATIARADNLTLMKKALLGENEPIVIVKNRQGLYYFIIGSYDDEAKARDKREMVKRRYKDPYTPSQLQEKYGTTFSEVWILIRDDN